MAGAGDRHVGAVYGYDEPNPRIVAWDKATGRYLGQYRLAGGREDWEDLRGLYVIPGVEERPATLVWLSKTGLHQAMLEAVPDDGASPDGLAVTHPQPHRDSEADQEALTGATPPMIPLRDANPTRQTPLVTLGLVVACFVVFACELGCWRAAGTPRSRRSSPRWGVVPADLTAAWGRGDVPVDRDADAVTSQFLHGGWLHLLGNLLYLWIFGNNVEDRFGRLGFLRSTSPAASWPALAQVAIDPTSTVPTIGASGAIAATLGAYLVLFPRARVTSLVFLGFFYQLIDVPAVIVLGVLVRAAAHRRHRVARR